MIASHYLDSVYDNKRDVMKYVSVNDALVHNCMSLGHRTEEKKLGRCYTEHTCKQCNIRWEVDSGD